MSVTLEIGGFFWTCFISLVRGTNGVRVMIFSVTAILPVPVAVLWDN
jgi:hypothetical protein